MSKPLNLYSTIRVCFLPFLKYYSFVWDLKVQITCMLNQQIRSLEGHNGRVAATGWNGHILTSGSGDKSIINHDSNLIICYYLHLFCSESNK